MEENKVFVHFDRWKGYDYWVKAQSLDHIYPLHFVKNNKDKFSRKFNDIVQPPQGVTNHDWSDYLEFLGAAQIPESWFQKVDFIRFSFFCLFKQNLIFLKA